MERKVVRRVVIGQQVRREKVERARDLRRGPTRAEDLLWQRLRKNQLLGLHFRRQQVIRGFVVDFYCHSAALVVEVDGEVHDRQTDRDRERDQILQALGFLVLHFRNDEVENDPAGVLARISHAVVPLPLPASGRGPGG